MKRIKLTKEDIIFRPSYTIGLENPEEHNFLRIHPVARKISVDAVEYPIVIFLMGKSLSRKGAIKKEVTTIT